MRERRPLDPSPRERLIRRPSFPRRNPRRARFVDDDLDDLFDWGGGSHDWPPPPAPDLPSSPTTTSFSQSSGTSSSIQHWAPKLFEQTPSNTPFRTTGPAYVRPPHDEIPILTRFQIRMYGRRYTKCQQYTRRRARESSTAVSYTLESKPSHRVLILRPFENGDLVVRFYVRLPDSRALIHCRRMGVNHSHGQSCIPLTMLRIKRSHSSLKLYRPSRNGQTHELWACLRFSSYERTGSPPPTPLCLNCNPRSKLTLSTLPQA